MICRLERHHPTALDGGEGCSHSYCHGQEPFLHPPWLCMYLCLRQALECSPLVTRELNSRRMCFLNVFHLRQGASLLVESATPGRVTKCLCPSSVSFVNGASSVLAGVSWILVSGRVKHCGNLERPSVNTTSY